MKMLRSSLSVRGALGRNVPGFLATGWNKAFDWYKGFSRTLGSRVGEYPKVYAVIAVWFIFGENLIRWALLLGFILPIIWYVKQLNEESDRIIREHGRLVFALRGAGSINESLSRLNGGIAEDLCIANEENANLKREIEVMRKETHGNPKDPEFFEA